MIIKIIDWRTKEVLSIECESCKYPTTLVNVMPSGELSLPVTFWKGEKEGTHLPDSINLVPPFSLFLMENGKTVDSLQYCEGYEKIAKE